MILDDSDNIYIYINPINACSGARDDLLNGFSNETFQDDHQDHHIPFLAYKMWYLFLFVEILQNKIGIIVF